MGTGYDLTLLPPPPPPLSHSTGASYVNIFYLLRTDSRFPEADRRLCINLTQISITLGILSGTLLELLTIYLES